MGATLTLFSHQSKSNEHYTDLAVVERARAVLRPGIDLDPASCELANRNIRARRIYTATTNGFTKRWGGNVFLNPPGGFCDALDGATLKKKKKGAGWIRSDGRSLDGGAVSSQRAWWFKLADEHASGRVEAAIFVCFSIELLQTTQAEPNGAIPLDFPICFPRKRLDYYKPTKAGVLVPGGAPPHASCIVFLPPRESHDDYSTTALDRFEKEFSSLGRVTFP